MTPRWVASTSIALGLLGAACWFPHVYGTATLAWTIEGRADPALCAEHDATFVHVVVRDDDEDVVIDDDWRACRDLDVRYVLRRGWHHATLTLADANRAALSPSRETGRFYVDGPRDVFVVVDFAAIGPAPAEAKPD